MVVRFATNGIGVARDAPAAEVSPIVKLLVENGADVDAGDSDGISALMWSAILGKTGLGAYLIENCADVNRTLSAKDLEGWTALHFAAGHGNIGLAKALLSAGAKINLPTTKGETPLAVARRFKQKAMVQFLLQSGAS